MRLTWLVCPISRRQDGVGVRDAEVAESVAHAAHTWKNRCRDSAPSQDDSVLVASGAEEIRDGIVVVKWEDLDKIRNSSFGLRDAIASFDPNLGDSCELVGGWVHLACDPVVSVRQGELVRDVPATWLPHSAAHRRDTTVPEYTLCFDEMMVHEFGHSLGLDNFDNPTRSVMYEVIADPRRLSEPSNCDCGFVRRIYSMPR